MLTLGAEFPLMADARVEHAAVNAPQRLRHEDLGVARVQGELARDIDHDARVWRELHVGVGARRPVCWNGRRHPARTRCEVRPAATYCCRHAFAEPGTTQRVEPLLTRAAEGPTAVGEARF